MHGVYDWFENCYFGYSTMFNMYFQMATKLVAITRATINENKNRYNINEDKYVIMNNSINFGEKIMKNNSMPQKIEKFLIISRLAPEKITSIKNAIKIFKKYHKEHQNSKLTIVGEGECKDEILNEIKSIEDNAIFLGARNDVIDLMLQNDVVIALGRCVLEAIATKRIAIISGYENVKGIITNQNIEEAARENFSGRNLEDENIDNLVKKLDKLKIEEIRNIVNENFSFAYENLNSKKNIFIIEENENLYINKTKYFEDVNILIQKVIDAQNRQDKIYADYKKAQKFFETQIENKEKENQDKKKEIQDKEREIQNKEREIKDLKLYIANLQEQIEAKNNENSELKNNLNKMICSKRWRYSSKIANLINKIKQKN